MSISDIQDIQKIIKSYILTTPLSDYKKILFFPSEIEKIIFSYNPVTSFYQLLINNETSIPDFNYKNFNYLELSKNPSTYHFIKYLLRDIDPINDFEVIEEFKKINNNDRILPHEYRLVIALSNINPPITNHPNLYAEFWSNINKYDSDFSILGDEKNYKHINFSNFSINKYIINIIEKKFFNKVPDVNLDKVTEFLLTYNIKINKEKLLLILSKCNNENIINFIKYCIDEKKIILDYDFLVNLSSSKNSLIHDMIYDTLKLEKKKLKKKFVNPFADILLHNNSIPDKIFDTIGLTNMKCDVLFKIKNNNIKKYIEKKLSNSQCYMPDKIKILCNNPNTIDILQKYIEYEKKLEEIDISSLLTNTTTDEKNQTIILDIFLKKYHYEQDNKHVTYVDGKTKKFLYTVKKDTLSVLQNIFNPKVLVYILDNDFLFDTKSAISYIKKENKSVDLKIFSDKLKLNLKYNYNAFEYIKKYDLWNILDTKFISTNPYCIKMLCDINFFKKFIFPAVEINLVECMNLYITFLTKISNNINKTQKYKKDIKKIYEKINIYMNDPDIYDEEKKLFEVIKTTIIKLKL